MQNREVLHKKRAEILPRFVWQKYGFQMNKTEKKSFILFLGRLVFTPESCSLGELTNEQKKEYCSFAGEKGLGALFYRYLKDSLPSKYQKKFQDDFFIETSKRLWELKEWEKLSKLLEQEKIPYTPIKGLDFAFNIYPEPAFRPHCDWDILFREEDCEKALKLLKNNGWETTTGHEPEKDNSEYHYSGLRCGVNRLEVHWSLPHFGTVASNDIWQEISTVNAGKNFLSPEMNLLLISAHASGGYYTHVSDLKILLDAGFLLKKHPINWDKVHFLADRWKILRPDILLSAWSEFFQEGVLPKEKTTQKHQQLIRKVFEMRDEVMKCQPYEKAMAQTAKSGIKDYLHFFSFFRSSYSVCVKYHLLSHQKGKIVLYTIGDFLAKTFYFLLHRKRRNPMLEQYYEHVREIKKIK